MTTPSKSKPNSSKNKPLLVAAAVVALAAAGMAWGATQYQAHQPRNYAQDVATPLEKSLLKAGAVKKCSRGDTGRGTDNNKPWHYAIFEVPGDRTAAFELSRAAFKEAGYDLVVGSGPPNPEDNKFYDDKTSKQSPYSDLEEGKIDLDLTVFGSSTHTGKGDQFCTVTKRENPPSDKTTILFTLSLPAYKQ